MQHTPSLSCTLMATPASAIAANGGTSASIWAKEPGPNRSGWAGKGAEPGAGRGGSRGRGGRGRGGRASNGRGGLSSKPDIAHNKPEASANQAQEKSSSDLPKSPVQPLSTAPASHSHDSAPSKTASRPRPPRRGSEQKGQRKGPSLTVDPSVTSGSNTSSSPSVSPRTPSRRKRGNSKASQPSAAPLPPTVPRKQSLSQENGAMKEKAALPPKDLPPHLAPHPPKATMAPFDIKHDIDALVERVRAVAMDRPHTPGSHIDWAGDEDDSLPDLDDWGVHPNAAPAESAKMSKESAASIISPILQDTLKPLPTLNDINIPTPSIRLHEVREDANDGHAGDETPRETAAPSAASPDTPTSTSHPHAGLKDTDAGSSAAPSSVPSQSNSGSSKPSRTPSPTKPLGMASSRHVPKPSCPDLSDIPSKDSSPSPSDRSLSASIHAMPPSAPSPTYLGPRPPRGVFQPSHIRAHTVGRYKPEHHSDNDRPHRGDAFSHGRNHSTPPTGPGTTRAHTRTHATRPVISGDAISRLAKTLGGSPLPRREKEPSAVKSD